MSQPAPERPGRYQRSVGGMVGAMVITLLAIGAFVGFRALNRDELEVRPVPVDYRAAVAAAQDSGFTPVYPASLPAGWTVTSADLPRTDPPAWGLGIVTAGGGFVGIRQSSEDLEDLLESQVDPVTTEGDPITVEGSVAPRWRSFSDEGGDRAYAAEVGSRTVLIYGSAPDEELRVLLSRLTTDPL